MISDRVWTFGGDMMGGIGAAHEFADGGRVTVDVTIGAILDERSGRKFQFAQFSGRLSASVRAARSASDERRRAASTTR